MPSHTCTVSIGYLTSRVYDVHTQTEIKDNAKKTRLMHIFEVSKQERMKQAQISIATQWRLFAERQLFNLRRAAQNQTDAIDIRVPVSDPAIAFVWRSLHE